MADLDNLMTLPGAIGAFKYSDKGELLEHRVATGAELSERILDLLCHLCVADVAIASMQARGWENLTGMKGFYPVEGFTLVGFKWSAVVAGDYGVVLTNEQADYEAAFAALAQ